ncbi:MAG: HD domain-containing protein [Deltaproteobacteria bacterium]|nr:HD domain-containing protein [Deltaproteobacteria bacterium]MBW2175621.1 HD domain-containing protein [Deltaproteobacteria bacterium]MBW2611584.1 HD domain-containing protein [Deltaproteobacteria bacterium]MBW2632620.1 HD domain-containing protein [Deltaproteobacteria bacterium]MBW2676186.1 HD domain-containing protein [Deltaproteobacteria bacterium]
MKSIVNLLFEARHLKDIPRTGYNFLGIGKESVAEHSFTTTFIAYVMSDLEPDADALHLVSLCLVHDLPESRIGDLNSVQKTYVSPDEYAAAQDIGKGTPLGESLPGLIREFNEGRTLEARLARDADQISFILELKNLADIGYAPPEKWLPYVLGRLKTDIGRKMADCIMQTERDEWWLKNLIDTQERTK